MHLVLLVRERELQIILCPELIIEDFFGKNVQ
jgi:hypothetical protein